MTIKDYKCKCGHDDFFFADKGSQKGIYCSYCGKWFKWADKDEQNLKMKPYEPKTGHWIHRTQDGGCFWEECSVCHTERAFSTKYCPDCGTYMYADIRTEAPAIIEADKESEG